MPKIPLVSQSAQKISDLSFDLKKVGSARVVAQAVVTALANQRTVSAHTKTRDEVRGGGKKPWKQKGTGRARHGSTRSPIWVGGGVTFGPRNLRNFTKSMNKSQRTLALQTVLSEQAQAGRLSVVEQLPGVAKTREALVFFKNVMPARAYLVIVDQEFNTTPDAAALHQAVRNAKSVSIRTATQVSTADIAAAHAIIATKAAFDYLTA